MWVPTTNPVESTVLTSCEDKNPVKTIVKSMRYTCKKKSDVTFWSERSLLAQSLPGLKAHCNRSLIIDSASVEVVGNFPYHWGSVLALFLV